MIGCFVTRDGVRLHVVDHQGEGLPLVFVHGGSAHARWWDFVIDSLGPGFRCLAMDLRGHGDSGWSASGAYALGDHAADLAAVLDEIGLERPVLIGHSLGSFVALQHALAHPRSLAALVMVDGRASFGATGTRYMRLLGMFGAARYESLDEAIERFRPMPQETIALPDVLAHVARHGVHPQGECWTTKFDRASLAGLDAFDSRSRLGEIECPVLFVRGEQSSVLSATEAARLAAACRHGRTVEIPGCHHHVLIDRPDLLANEIRAFLGDSVLCRDRRD